MSGRMNAGIALMSNIFPSVPAFSGGSRVLRLDGLTKFGIRPKNSSHSLVLNSPPAPAQPDPLDFVLSQALLVKS